MKRSRNAINRSELIDQLARKQHYTPETVDTVIKVMLSEIGQALAQHQRVEIRGFGHFETRQYPAQIRVNPKTGQSVAVEGRCNVHFAPGKQLKSSVNKND